MKTNITGRALALSLAVAAALASSVLAAASPSTATVSLALPGEETPLVEGVALFAPPDLALMVDEPAGQHPCPTVHPSLAGDLCEVERKHTAKEGDPEDEDPYDGRSGNLFALVDGSSTPEPTIPFLAAFAGAFVLGSRRRDRTLS